MSTLRGLMFLLVCIQTSITNAEIDIASCQSETAGCNNIIDGENFACHWQNLSAPMTVSLTLVQEEEFYGVTFVHCSNYRNAIEDIRIDFGDGSSYETSLTAWLNPSSDKLFEVIYFPRVTTNHLDISILSTYDNRGFGLVEILVYNSDLDVAGEHLGGTCEASHPGCEYLLDNYSGWIPSDFNWVFTGNALDTEVIVWFLHRYTLYDGYIWQLYDNSTGLSSCHLRDLQLTFDDGSRQQITLPECFGDDGKYAHGFSFEPVTTESVHITVLSTYPTSHPHGLQGLSEIYFLAGEPLTLNPTTDDYYYYGDTTASSLDTQSPTTKTIPHPTTTNASSLASTTKTTAQPTTTNASSLASTTMISSLPSTSKTTAKPTTTKASSLPSTSMTSPLPPTTMASPPPRTTVATGTSELPDWVWPVVGIVVAVIFAIVIIIIVLVLRKRRNKSSPMNPPPAVSQINKPATDGNIYSVYDEITEYIPTVHSPPNKAAVVSAAGRNLQQPLYYSNDEVIPQRNMHRANANQQRGTDDIPEKKKSELYQREDTYLEPVSSTSGAQSVAVKDKDNEYLEMLSAKSHYGNDYAKPPKIRK